MQTDEISIMIVMLVELYAHKKRNTMMNAALQYFYFVTSDRISTYLIIHYPGPAFIMRIIKYVKSYESYRVCLCAVGYTNNLVFVIITEKYIFVQIVLIIKHKNNNV